jgi:hypothetical protein
MRWCCVYMRGLAATPTFVECQPLHAPNTASPPCCALIPSLAVPSPCCLLPSTPCSRVTTLSGWALTLCPSLDPNAPPPAVARADGGADAPATPSSTEAPGGVDVSVSMDMANMTRMGPLGAANVSAKCRPLSVCPLLPCEHCNSFTHLYVRLSSWKALHNLCYPTIWQWAVCSVCM